MSAQGASPLAASFLAVQSDLAKDANRLVFPAQLRHLLTLKFGWVIPYLFRDDTGQGLGRKQVTPPRGQQDKTWSWRQREAVRGPHRRRGRGDSAEPGAGTQVLPPPGPSPAVLLIAQAPGEAGESWLMLSRLSLGAHNGRRGVESGYGTWNGKQKTPSTEIE